MQTQKPQFFIKKLNPNAKLPSKGSEKAAGYDIHALSDYVVPAKGKELVKTGLSFGVPPGNYARIAPRSGLAWKYFIDVGAGVIDEDYRGEVGVILFNHSEQDFVVNAGDRIAQVIIEKITDTELMEVDSLDQTERGQGGFGSTGVKDGENQELKRKLDDQVQKEIENLESLQLIDEVKKQNIINSCMKNPEKASEFIEKTLTLTKDKKIEEINQSQVDQMVQEVVGEKSQ